MHFAEKDKKSWALQQSVLPPRSSRPSHLPRLPMHTAYRRDKQNRRVTIVTVWILGSVEANDSNQLSCGFVGAPSMVNGVDKNGAAFSSTRVCMAHGVTAPACVFRSLQGLE